MAFGGRPEGILQTYPPQIDPNRKPGRSFLAQRNGLMIALAGLILVQPTLQDEPRRFLMASGPKFG
jgi:hypothetical protein